MTIKNVTPEEFKKTSVAPGKKERFYVQVGEMSTGSEVSLPVIVASGQKDGPCVLITAGMHAEEAACIDAVMRFSAQVDPKDISGTLVMVPCQNAPAWAHRSRLYPFDAPSLMDIFSLKAPDAKGAMTARVLHTLLDCIGANANFGLDIHATHLDSMNYPRTMTLITGDESPEVHEKRIELSRKVGYEIVHFWNMGSMGGLTQILNSRGCPAIAIEAGEGWRSLEPFPSILIRGIRNFCKAVGALDGEPELPDVTVEVTRRVEITASKGGFSNLFVTCGQYVRAGEVVGQVRNLFDDVVEELTTPINGIVIRCSLLPTVATGARLCNVYETDIGKTWEYRMVPELESQISFSGHSRPRAC